MSGDAPGPKPKATCETPLTGACAFCGVSGAPDDEGIVVRRGNETLMAAHGRCLRVECAVDGDDATLDLAPVVALPRMALEWHPQLSQLSAARALAKVMRDVSFVHPNAREPQAQLRSAARPAVRVRAGWFGAWCAVCETRNWGSSGLLLDDGAGARLHVHKCCLTPEYWEGADNVYAVMRIHLRREMTNEDAEAALDLIDELMPWCRISAGRRRFAGRVAGA